MPADFEYDLDHDMVDMAAWDHVSIDDLLTCFERLATLPADLSKSANYLDLGEASGISISELGAIQLGLAYEKLLEREMQGFVIFAPDERVAGTMGMIMSTLADLVGPLPEGFYVIRAPMPPAEVRKLLRPEVPRHGIVLES